MKFGRPGCGRLFRAMTRCECTATSFDEVARRLRQGQSLDEAQAETGAGLLCTACLPDLREHAVAVQQEIVAARAASPQQAPDDENAADVVASPESLTAA